MLRLSECYASFQGEGPNTGKPTIFVRFAGCNFKCAGWPCDTPHAIDPAIFTKEQEPIMPGTLYQRITESAQLAGIMNVCLTGGEPFLQNHDELHELVDLLHSSGHRVEAFTNGSLVWSPSLAEAMDTLIVDWKLPGSGEYPDESNLTRNLQYLCETDAIKFTVKDREDFDRAMANYHKSIAEFPYQLPAHRPVVWCGPVWGCLTPDTLAAWILEEHLSWNLNIQTHKYIWSAEARGV